MRTDIHMSMEKRKPGQPWEFVADDSRPRRMRYPELYLHDGDFYMDEEASRRLYSVGGDYRLFGFLAGVRGGAPSIFGVRGLPSDMSKVLQERIEVGHTPSWLTCDECLAVLSALARDGEWINPGFEQVVMYMCELHTQGYEARIVFYFDS